MIILDKEQFEGAKVLAEIGAKIAAGRAALTELESGKRDFLDGREAEAIARVGKVLANSKELLAEVSKYHSELVGYRIELEGFLEKVLYLVQSVETWKADFDREIGEKNKEIDQKLSQNEALIVEIKGQRALLAGETTAIKGKRAALEEDMVKIRDEWATLGRAAKEINSKK